MNISSEQLILLLPAFAAGCLVASTHVPLGIEVLKRGIIFIDLAIAQIAALGVVIGHLVFNNAEGIYSLIFALVFALSGGGLFAWLEAKKFQHLEAMIGAIYVFTASIAILLLSHDPHGAEVMEKLLTGQILWATWWPDIIITMIMYAALLLIWFTSRNNNFLVFYFIFPIAITFSVQIAGVYLVFASLIIPALGVSKLKEKTKLSVGYTIALLSIFIGLLVSLISDLPAGPMLVCSYFIISTILLCSSYRRSLYIE
ncbi:MAG: metal ABC transporter permease [Gammaproteobacteria bacterium]|nr:metal ABC transporter permease [Gammaproteobacteria bacterium]NNC67083.1 metal ABC transporter permease [Gammaproteobacteria bacterium]